MMKHGLSFCFACGIIALYVQSVPGIDAFQHPLLCMPSLGHIEASGSSRSTRIHRIQYIGTKSVSAATTTFSIGNHVRVTQLLDNQQPDAEKISDEEVVEVGTKEYYSGFLSSPIQDETVAERGSGLEQALKLAGGVLVVLVALVAGFMASNGLL